MHPLILTGLTLLGIALVSVAFSLFLSLRSGAAGAVRVSFRAYSVFVAMWVVVSFLFRAGVDAFVSPRWFVAAIGPILSLVALGKLAMAMSACGERIQRWRNQVLAITAFVFIVLSVYFLTGPVYVRDWPLPSGLLRYELTPAGHLLFAAAFLVLSASTLLIAFGFNGKKRSVIPATILVFLAQAAVVFPLKELALPPVLLSLALLLYLKPIHNPHA